MCFVYYGEFNADWGGCYLQKQYSLQSWLHEPLLDVLFVHPNKVSQGIYGAHGLLQYNENKDTLAVCQS